MDHGRDRPEPHHSHGHERDHDHGGGHEHGHEHAHRGGLRGWLRHTFAHSHGVHGRVDEAMATNERGIWALKVSLLGLGATALFQVAIVLLSDSTALLADTIHNVGDAATSLPLWLSFALQRRERNRRSPTATAGRRTWPASSSSA